MKILLDECVPQPLRHHFAGHDVSTVGFLGRQGTKNGRLLRRATEFGFSVLLTIDTGYEKEQNLDALPLAVVLIDLASDDFNALVGVMPNVNRILATLTPRSFVKITAANC